MSFVIIAKFAIATVGVIVALALRYNNALLSMPHSQFDRLLYGAALVSRAGLFTIVYGILGFHAQSDALIYYHWSLAVLAGHIPGESADLPLVYGPIFLYLTLLPLPLGQLEQSNCCPYNFYRDYINSNLVFCRTDRIF